MTFSIHHPVTGDWAEADDLPAAERAAQVLRADALDAGTCTSPRVKCHIILDGSSVEADPAAAGRRAKGGPHGQQ